jgi:hypothetical protein
MKRWQKTAALGRRFRHLVHQSPTRASGPFNHFLGSGAPSAQSASTADCCSRFRPPLSLTLPPSSEGPILAPRALSPKWTSLHLPCASSLAVYTGLCYQPQPAIQVAYQLRDIAASRFCMCNFSPVGRSFPSFFHDSNSDHGGGCPVSPMFGP